MALTDSAGPRPWREAMSEALYGESGFYRRTTARDHYRTSPTASARFASALGLVAAAVDEMLGRPDPFDIVDVGAGDGSLLHALGSDAPASWRLTGVEITPRPDSRVIWRTEVPGCTGLLIANEWLDNVPCDVVERTGNELRLVCDDDSMGPRPSAADADWLARWWPLRADGNRAEVGRPRDEAWAAAVGRLDRGVAVAIDYAHDRAARPALGTLTGYRGGRQVPPVADGSVDLTAHVALDACAASAQAATEVSATLLTTQRRALRSLGLSSEPPTYAGDPLGYLRALSAAGEAAELGDPSGLGGFGWLVQAVGVALPRALTTEGARAAPPPRG